MEHAGRHGVGRRFVAADEEVEGRKEAIRRLHGGIDHRRGLGHARALGLRQGQGVAEHHFAVVGPDLEMAEPDPLIDEVYQFVRRRPPRLVGLEIDRQAELQAIRLGAPREP
jgi:hypothetical protein